ncbi:hypothetical protein [Saccharibacillus qingshengii]|uniref:hypothetical protein n=1 Tax=Saccharibacillus qingshengii TaxID=1763540 RepID=UPI0015574986|nr:hypothetical protein [Saccharibacillus qingshengii]
MTDDTGTIPVASETDTETVPVSSTDSQQPADPATAAEAPAPESPPIQTAPTETTPTEIIPPADPDPQPVTTTTSTTVLEDPQILQSIKDLHGAVDNAHLTLIFGIALVAGIQFTRSLLEGWFHA